ncbi:hypothetical protein [Georgenia sp. AZ-5]|uniref:hypothetical protein n=1 Tax=Georgenia sp. AZ-5 TaxID=3367526 RepID=UPI003754E220
MAALLSLGLLIGGPQPRLATKWAWFWLAVSTPLWTVFLLLEPVPVWSRSPAPVRERRLTGGWAFVLSLTAVPLVLGMVRELVVALAHAGAPG